MVTLYLIAFLLAVLLGAFLAAVHSITVSLGVIARAVVGLQVATERDVRGAEQARARTAMAHAEEREFRSQLEELSRRQVEAAERISGDVAEGEAWRADPGDD